MKFPENLSPQDSLSKNKILPAVCKPPRGDTWCLECMEGSSRLYLSCIEQNWFKYLSFRFLENSVLNCPANGFRTLKILFPVLASSCRMSCWGLTTPVPLQRALPCVRQNVNGQKLFWNHRGSAQLVCNLQPSSISSSVLNYARWTWNILLINQMQ